MKNVKRVFIAFLFLALTTSCGLSAAAYAAVPHLINYQGRVTDTSGAPLTGSYNITFRIYDALTAGNLLWEETQTGVVVDKGLFGVLLGSVTALNTAFDKPYFLEVKVGTEVMSPRQRITSAGYAIRAEVAEGLSGPGKVGTKAVNETNIGNGKVPVYRTTSGKYELEAISSSAKVVFSFALTDDNGASDGGIARITSTYGPQAIDTLAWEYWGVKATTYGQVIRTKFKKEPGITTVTFYALMENSDNQPGYCLVDIGGQTGQAQTVATHSLQQWVVGSVNVSQLVDGNVYNVSIKLKTTTFGEIIGLYSIIAIAS